LGGSSSVGRTTYSFSNTSTAYQLSVTGGSAYNLTWNPATSSGTWNTTDTNTPWLNNTDSSSTYFATGDNVTLGSAATIAVDAGGVTAGTMALTNATGTVALSGGSIGASSLTQSGAGTVTMNNALSVAGALTNSAGTLANNSTTAANSLVVSGGTVNLNGAASITNGVTVSGGAVTLATNSTISGGVNVSSGSLALNGANTISGGVTNTGGTLLVGNNGALGNATLFVSNNGVLGVTNSAMTLLTNAVTVGVGGATVSNSVATTLGGSITNVSGSANLTLTKDGSGALTLTNALGVTGSTGSIALNVTNGNLVLSGAQKYITNSQINTGAKVILDGVTVNARGAKLGGGGTIEVTNNSAWNNSIANSSITNAVAIGSGSKLSVGTSSSYYLEFLNGITGAGNFTVTTGGTNRITGISTVAYMTVDSGGRLYLNNGTASNTVITNNGTVDIGISSGITNITGLSSGTTTYNGNISGNGNISISGSQNIYLAGNISGVNTVSLDSGSTGTQVFLTGSNSFSGGINFAHTNARQAYFGNSNALGTGTISNNTSTTSTLAYSGSANTADYTFANAFYTGTTNTAILSIQTGISNTVRLGGVVSGLGQFKITSSSNGIVYLNNANNTYSGGTEIG
ncbi:MAG: hypothetical protein EBS59_08215, partial [Verrucomicrobia bacterium]|nr:hypothetical protein [Verrucomicrobiota bacterium]